MLQVVSIQLSERDVGDAGLVKGIGDAAHMASDAEGS